MLDSAKIVVTGSNGFLGRHLRRTIVAAFPGAHVIGWARDVDPSDPSSRAVNPSAENSVASALEEFQPDIIFHCAGTVSSPRWETLYAGNVSTTTGLLDGMVCSQSKAKVVVPGSAAEIGDVHSADLPISEEQLCRPSSPYGVSKVWQSTAIRFFTARGLPIVTGRLFNLIGQGISEHLSVGTFRKQIVAIHERKAGGPIRVGNLSAERDFLDVEDACAGLISLATHGRAGETYNICSGVPVSMHEILQRMIKSKGIDVEIEVDPARFRPNDQPRIYGSNSKIRQETGWTPAISLTDSIAGFLK
ncbi:MAG: NAD-dependent epimerase/dehydratase family protein [Gemmatimonadota bacterium]